MKFTCELHEEHVVVEYEKTEQLLFLQKNGPFIEIEDKNEDAIIVFERTVSLNSTLESLALIEMSETSALENKAVASRKASSDCDPKREHDEQKKLLVKLSVPEKNCLL